MTSAPRSASCIAAYGAAMNVAASTTRTPASGGVMAARSGPPGWRGERDQVDLFAVGVEDGVGHRTLGGGYPALAQRPGVDHQGGADPLDERHVGVPEDQEVGV